MTQELHWIYGFNIIVNSTLSFFTSLFLIQCFMYLFKIHQPRVKAIAQMIPFFKIVCDLCLYQYSNWALLSGVNPLLAEKNTRILTLLLNPFAGIQFSMEGGKTFSFADCLALNLDPFWVRLIVFVACAGALLSSLFYGVRIFNEKKEIRLILKKAKVLEPKNLRPILSSWIHLRRVKILISNEVFSPCIFGKTIFIPSSLSQSLSAEELEAVIAHELGHFQWRDGTLRVICSLISSLFWWIPTRGMQKQIEQNQEQASDTMIHTFGISHWSLAEAILKTAHLTKENQTLLTFSFAGRKSLLKNRMQKLLEKPKAQNRKWKTARVALFFCSLASIFFGRLWIF